MNMTIISRQNESCKDRTSRLLVSLEEAGHMLGISARTVRRMSEEGVLPSIVKMGHSSRMSYPGIIDYVARLTKGKGGVLI